MQLDSIAFFPYLAWGANNELAGIATLMAVLETIGKMKKDVRAYKEHIVHTVHMYTVHVPYYRVASKVQSDQFCMPSSME